MQCGFTPRLHLTWF